MEKKVRRSAAVTLTITTSLAAVSCCDRTTPPAERARHSGIALTPRPNWKERLESTVLTFHSIGGQAYGDESACYELSVHKVDELEHATNQLHELCIAAVEHVIDKNKCKRLKTYKNITR